MRQVRTKEIKRAEDKSQALQAIGRKKSSDFETTTPPVSNHHVVT